MDNKLLIEILEEIQSEIAFLSEQEGTVQYDHAGVLKRKIEQLEISLGVKQDGV
jgi:hypothetical protein